ncbi:acyl transferase/acyl hydrolase/lysophospholipase [Ochromonadaceae sp. CCMP2298]|nr:acyl transferase/acyl hydrolase/lysophospholipase [Ochromonadaceae sp. CCMP2298]
MRYSFLCAALLLCRLTYGLISVLRDVRKSRFAPRGGGRMPQGFDRPRDAEGNVINSRPDSPKEPIAVQSVAQLKDLFHQGYKVKDLDVRGDIAELLEDASYMHPVVRALHERKQGGSKPGERGAEDKARIAIAIEGGGMRGAVGAGMITAFNYLGLQDSIDVVYGSSAGSLVGAYFLAEQVPHYGLEVYYDILPAAGREFIDAQSILRSCGLGLFDLRFKSIVDLFTDRMGKPVLNLSYLLDSIVQNTRQLDWAVFWEKQRTGRQPLKVVASGLLSQQSVIMSAADRNFESLPELCECMKASMLIPGVAGDVVRLKGRQAEADNIRKTYWPEYDGRRTTELVAGSEPMTDALVYEPIPYRSALAENCTQVVVLRTRGDGVRMTAKGSLVEKMIMTRFFGRKQGMPNLVKWMHNQYHKLVYAEDVLLLNEANRDTSPLDPSQPRLYGIAKPKGIAELGRMETNKKLVFEGIRTGFAAAHEALVLDPAERGKGYLIATQIWPDSLIADRDDEDTEDGDFGEDFWAERFDGVEGLLGLPELEELEMGDIDMDIDMEELGLGGGMRAEVEQEVPRGSRDGRDSRDAYTAPLRELMAEDLEVSRPLSTYLSTYLSIYPSFYTLVRYPYLYT